MADTITVEMQLTTETCKQAELLRQRFGCASKAQAVSTSLSLVALLTEAVAGEEMLMIRMPNGELQKLNIAGLTR